MIIRPASHEEAVSFLGEFQCQWDDVEVAIINSEIVAMGGFARLHENHDRLWAFLNINPKAQMGGFQIVRRMMRRLHDRNETVFIQCDGDYAMRLLRFLGFEPTNEIVDDMRDEANSLRVWKWQNWLL